MGGIGAGIAIGGQILGGLAERDALQQQQESNEQINAVNQQAARLKVEEQRQQTRAKISALTKRGKRVRGKTVGAVAKSGVQLAGSPMDVLIENMANVEQDKAQTFRDGQIMQQNTMSQAAMDSYAIDVKHQELETRRTTALIDTATGIAGTFGTRGGQKLAEGLQPGLKLTGASLSKLTGLGNLNK